jgi:uncharacterized repeat protein (TIGR02543 family)
LVTSLTLLNLRALRKIASWTAVLAIAIAPQYFQPSSASATTATISDVTNNCQVPVTSSTITIDSVSTSISLVGSRCIVKFLTVGSYTITMPGGVASLDYLVVGGGGGGGSGGGGAGGVLQGTNYAVTAGNTYTVSVGAGGSGGRGGANSGAAPHSTNGDPSIFASVTALGGGAGGEGSHSPDHAGNGASGGGARFDCTSITCIGTGTIGQGTNGAASTHGGYGGGAGGGGAGGAGGNTILYHIGGKGGDGVQSSITGTATYYGGGGGGGINSNDNQYCGLNSPGTSDSNYYCNQGNPVTTGGGAGGLGGGGRGSSWGYTGGAQGDISIGGKANGTAGAANTGGGGGGTDPEDAYAYAGGSGIVVISYVSPANFRSVTFNANNGSGSTTTQWVQSGVATPLQTNPYTYTGYVFQGWNTSADGSGTGYTNLANLTTTTAVTLYAQWRAGVTHSVTFDANGGSGTMAAQVAGQATNLNANALARTGYTFAGWNTAANGSGYTYLDQTVYSFAADATLYAQWTIVVVPHSVSFYGNGATSGTTSSQTASSTQALTLNGFSRTGYNFLGWNTNNTAGTASYMDGQNYSFSADLSLYAIWVAQAPNVITFNGNGSTSGSMATETASSSTVLNSNAFVRTGYTFLYWNTAANGSGVNYQSSYTYSFAQSITLYAIWGQNFTISYDGNTNTGGSAPGSQSSYVGGSALTLQSNTGNLTKTGYLLSGWNTAANGSGTAYAIGQTNVAMNAGVTLYAQWLGATYVVLYTANGSTSGTTPSSQTYTYGSAGITLRLNSGTLAKTGYTFAGWNTSPDGLGTSYGVGATSVTFSQDTVLFAQWTPNQATITYVYNGSDGGDATASVIFATGGPALVLPAPSKTGYTFVAWYSDSGLTTLIGSAGASYSPSTASPTLSLYAKWSAKTYAVTYSYNGADGGQDTVSDSFTTAGSAITLPTPTRTGYTFAGWYSDSGFTSSIGSAGASFAPATVSTAITAYAKWSAKTYTVIYSYNGADGGNSDVSASFTTAGSAITLPTPTRTGYTFAGWYSDSGLTTLIGAAGASYSPNTLSLTLEAFAKWSAKTYSVTYSYNGADGGNSDVSASFTTAGSAITLPTPTRAGYTFVGWYSDSGFTSSIGSAGASFAPATVSTAITAYAKWSAKTYSVTYSYNGADDGDSDVSASFTTGGSAITLPTPTRTGYTFAGWYADSGLTTLIGAAGASYSPNTISVTLGAYARWNTGTYAVIYNYGGADGGNSTSSASFTTGGTAVTLPTPTRTHFHFDGWFDASTGGSLVGAGGFRISPTSERNIFAHWTQDSLFGIGSSSKIGSLTLTNGLGTQYTATGSSNSVNVTLPSGSLPDGTILDVYLLNDHSSAQSIISGTNNFIVSLVVSWLAVDGTVPTTTVGKPVVVTISNAAIKAGASIYRLVGGVAEFVGIASQDGVAQVSLTDDPELVIAATVPSSPLTVEARLSGTTASVSWLAPLSSGGADISSYLVTSSSGMTCTSQTLSCEISGLTYGDTQTFTVQALNEVGLSLASGATSPVTPMAPQVSSGGGGGGFVNVPNPAEKVSPDPATWLPPTLSQQVLSGQNVLVTESGVVPTSVIANPEKTGLIATAGPWSIALNLNRAASAAPAIIDSKLQLFAGESVSISGSGLLPNNTVKVWLYSTPKLISTITSKADGSFASTLIVPLGLELGNHTLVFQSIGADLKVQNQQFPVTVQSQVLKKYNLTFTKSQALLSKSSLNRLAKFSNSLTGMAAVTVKVVCYSTSSISSAASAKLCSARLAKIKSSFKAQKVLATFAKPTTLKVKQSIYLNTVRLSVSAVVH